MRGCALAIFWRMCITGSDCILRLAIDHPPSLNRGSARQRELNQLSHFRGALHNVADVKVNVKKTVILNHAFRTLTFEWTCSHSPKPHALILELVQESLHRFV